MSGNFEVEEYKKPEYEVRVTPAKPRVLQGETVQATIDARYYFGEPVSGAKVSTPSIATATGSRSGTTPRTNPWRRQTPDDDDDTGDQIARGEGQLDADGKLTINVDDHASPSTSSTTCYRVEARVTDQANREITGKGWVVATYGSFAVNVDARPLFLRSPAARPRSPCRPAITTTSRCAPALTWNCCAWNCRDTAKRPRSRRPPTWTPAPNGSATAELDIPRAGRLLSRARHGAHARRPRRRRLLVSSGSPAAALGLRFRIAHRTTTSRSSPIRRPTTRAIPRKLLIVDRASPTRRSTSRWKAATCGSTS